MIEIRRKKIIAKYIAYLTTLIKYFFKSKLFMINMFYNTKLSKILY